MKITTDNNNSQPQSSGFSFVPHEVQNVDVELSFTPEFPFVSSTANKEIAALVSLKSPKYTASRCPVDLCFVIDNSGSMSGSKLTLMKQTLKFVVQQLNPNDRLGLVVYNSTVTTPLGLTNMDDNGKRLALGCIESINANGGTNLCSGLCTGITMMRNRGNFKNTVSSVLLFTDGQANEGYTSKTDISKAMFNPTFANSSPSRSSPFQQQQILGFGSSIMSTSSQPVPLTCSVNTFGFGADHDASLLRGISESGEGIYYYIENSDAIPTSFADCLGGLMSVTAQNISIKLETRQDVFVNSIKTKFKYTTDRPAVAFTISIPDLQSEETKDIPLAIKLPSLPQPDEKYGLIKLTLSYFNTITKQQVNKELVTGISRPLIEPPQQPNVYVDKQRNRVVCAEAMEKADQKASAGQLDQARQTLDAAITFISRSVSFTDPFCKALVDELESCKRNLRDKSTYDNIGSKFLHNNMSAQYHQRSSNMASAAQACYSNSQRVELAKAFRK